MEGLVCDLAKNCQRPDCGSCPEKHPDLNALGVISERRLGNDPFTESWIINIEIIGYVLVSLSPCGPVENK